MIRINRGSCLDIQRITKDISTKLKVTFLTIQQVWFLDGITRIMREPFLKIFHNFLLFPHRPLACGMKTVIMTNDMIASIAWTIKAKLKVIVQQDGNLDMILINLIKAVKMAVMSIIVNQKVIAQLVGKRNMELIIIWTIKKETKSQSSGGHKKNCL